MIDGVDTTFLVQLEIEESAGHTNAERFLRERVIEGDEILALTPQVINEFIHVVSDPRRFERPLSVKQALSRGEFWWQAREIQRVFATSESVDLSMKLMHEHDLGRKRILDTFLACTYLCGGIDRIVTTNSRDYGIFEGLTVIVP
jgi:predicted nucleic acid-binding protein